MKNNLAANARRLSFRINTMLLLLTMVAAALLFLMFAQAERMRLEKSLVMTATQVQSAISQMPGAAEVLVHGETESANALLQPILARLASEQSNIGLGVYSKEQDCVVAVHPFNPAALKPASHSFPCFEVYATGRLKLSPSDSAFDWNGDASMSVTVPLFSGTAIIGHVWANMRTQFLYKSIAKTMLVLFGLWFIAYLSTRKAIWRAFAAIGRDIAASAEADEAGEGADKVEPPRELSPLLQVVQRQKRAIQEQSEQKDAAKRDLETLFNISRDYICIVKDGFFLNVNPAFCKALGFSEQELIGKQYMEFLHPTNHAATEEQQQLLRRGETLQMQNRYLCADGTLKEISWVAVGHQGKTYAIGRDVTEQRRIDEHLARLDRLNLAGEMAASISHEIRNPLTTVRGFIQLAKIRSDRAVFDEHYQTMMEELDRANAIITEYLSLAKDKAYTRKKASLNKLLLTLEPLIQAEALMRGHQLVMELADIPLLSVDENEIRQMVLNLVKNGLEAMQEPGVLVIRTRTVEGGVTLEVSDQGPGIPSEVLDRIPTPFFTTKEQGTGLGLAVCYRIAEHHEAEIRISTSSQGTDFTVRFPPL